MKLYKLTDENGQTYGGCQWGENVTHGEGELLEGEGPLCSGHWYYAYQDPMLAVLMNPAHANFKKPRLWEAEGNPGKVEPDKVGCKSLITIREIIPLPEVTVTQRIAFGILASLEVYDNPMFVGWAEEWLSGEDRSRAAADATATATAADAAARATAARATAKAAADAAARAAAADDAAARAATTAAWAAARAATAADAAATRAAARAAAIAAAIDTLNLVTLMRKALRY